MSWRFRLVSQHSACGPDEIPGAVLKHCHDSLAPVFTSLFQRSLGLGHIPSVWKSSTVVPVSKKPSPSALNNYHPIALISIPFKCMDKCMNDCSWPPSCSKTLCCLPTLQTEIRRMLSWLWSMPFWRSPDALPGLLIGVQHNPASPADVAADGHRHQPCDHLVALQLPDRPRVVVGSSITLEVSSEVRTNTGAPQGCVLSAVLFTLHTSACQWPAKDAIQVRFSDDTSLTGLITTSENSYCCAVEKLVGWCNDNHLLLNIFKIKEIVMDFSPTGYQWRGSWDHQLRVGLEGPPEKGQPAALLHKEAEVFQRLPQVPGLSHWLQVGLVPEGLGPPEKGQPAALLHKEAEVFQLLPQVAGAVV